MFLKTYPENANIDDILVKCATLNDFYRTNIFKIFPVAKHILSLDIDERLRDGDPSLVNEIARVKISGKSKKFYSFATKYCSHHSPNDYPIYDYDVERVLVHFKKNDNFYQFTNADLRDYVKFKEIILVFQKFYNLQRFNLK